MSRLPPTTTRTAVDDETGQSVSIDSYAKMLLFFYKRAKRAKETKEKDDEKDDVIYL